MLCCPVVLQIQCCVVQVSGRYSAVLYSFGVDTVLCSTVLWQMQCCVVKFSGRSSAVLYTSIIDTALLCGFLVDMVLCSTVWVFEVLCCTVLWQRECYVVQIDLC